MHFRRLSSAQILNVLLLIWLLGSPEFVSEARFCSKSGCMHDYCCLMKRTYGKTMIRRAFSLIPVAYIARCNGRNLNCFLTTQAPTTVLPIGDTFQSDEEFFNSHTN